MRDTRSSGSQENPSIEKFLKSNEFQKIISKAVKIETKILMEKVCELKEEMTILRKSNIDLIKLLTNSKETPPPRQEKQEHLMVKRVDQTFGNITKSKVSLCRREEKVETIPECNEEIVSNIYPESNKKSDWSIVQSKKRSGKSNGIVGKDNGNGKIKAAERKTQLYVSRLHPSTTVSDLTDFLKDKFPEVHCEQGRSKFPESYSSFKVTINEANHNVAMNPELWPVGIYINKFFRGKNSKPPTN